MAEIYEEHYLTHDGAPNGGETVGVGLQIYWQAGLVQNGQQNGAFVEDVLQAALGRLQHYQETRFQCDRNQAAIDCITQAIEQIQARQLERQNLGIANTHIPTPQLGSQPINL